MNILLDTHVLLWWMADHPMLSARARGVIASEENDVAISVASLWEIALKAGRMRLRVEVTDVEEASREGGFGILSIEPRHVRSLGSLPHVHGDPFDRMLVAQARAEPRYLLTADRQLRGYGDSIILI